jgi:Polyketide cyclase / dehydrase and lipid transport
MGTLKRSGRVETVTDASPEQVWAVVADVTRVGEWSHECRGAVWLDGATTAVPGARFGGSNRLGRFKWSRVNEIVAADAPNELVWRTVPSRVYPDSTEWRIRIEREGDSTRIVQTFEVLKLNPVMDRLIYLVTPAHRDRLPALAGDIRRLGEVAAQQPAVSAR